MVMDTIILVGIILVIVSWDNDPITTRYPQNVLVGGWIMTGWWYTYLPLWLIYC